MRLWNVKQGNMKLSSFFEQRIAPDFSKLILEGRDKSNNPYSGCSSGATHNKYRSSFATLNFEDIAVIFYSTTHEVSVSTRSPPSYADSIVCNGFPMYRVTSKTIIGVTLSHITGDQYEIAMSVEGEPLNACSFELQLTNDQKNNAVLKTYQNYITKLVIQ